MQNSPVKEFFGGVDVFSNCSNDVFASLTCHAASCKMLPNKKHCNHQQHGFDLECIQVEFWNEESSIIRAVHSVELCFPSLGFTVLNFLDELERSVWKHKIVSIIDGYVYKGLIIPFKTINRIHQALI
jgi:hypothetical protein